MSQFEPPKPVINFPNGIQHKEHPVTNHKQAAIEAGTKIQMGIAECQLFQLTGDPECEVHGDDFNLDSDEDAFCVVAYGQASETLDAMLPHIREMIAQEIRAEKITSANTNLDILHNTGLELAARIAEGQTK